MQSRWLALIAVTLGVALCSATLAYAGQITYFGRSGSAVYSVAYKSTSSGSGVYQWNRVYRPLGRYFSLWYEANNTAYQFDRNSTNNPFWHQQSSPVGVQSVCVHSDGGSNQSPVTCETYK